MKSKLDIEALTPFDRLRITCRRIIDEGNRLQSVIEADCKRADAVMEARDAMQRLAQISPTICNQINRRAS